MEVAQINIYQRTQDGESKTYGWSLKDFGNDGDESAGAPMGHGKHTIAAALLEAVNCAKINKYDGARVTYYPIAGPSKELDCKLDSTPLDTERARAFAKKLMEST